MNTRLSIALLTLTCLVVSPAVRAQDADDPFKRVVTYSVENSRRDCAAVEAEIRKATPAQYAAIEAKLIAILKDPQATADAKIFVCRQLAIVGSPNCVPAVAPLLLEEKTSHAARMALEPNASPIAASALRQALPQAKGKLLVGIISSLGARRDAEAVKPLADLLKSQDESVVLAAIAALGQIGTGEAVLALESAGRGKTVEPVATAMLTAARHLATDGNTTTATAVYLALAAPSQPKFIQIAATRGLIGTLDKAAAARLIIQTMQSDDVALRSAPLAAIQDPSETALRKSLAEQLPEFNADAQAALLTVLADQDDVALRPTLLKLLDQSGSAQVRSAAIAALARHGQAADVAPLVKLAAARGADAAAAARTLQRIAGAGVAEALVQQAQSGDPAAQVVAINVIAARREAKAMDALVRLMGSADADVAGEAVKAVSTLGTVDQLPTLLGIIAQTTRAPLRSSAENAAKAICVRAADKPAAARALLSALPDAPSPTARAAMLRILSRVPSEQTLAAVRSAMKDANAEVADAATRELIDWPDIAAAPAILDLARSATVERDKVLALRGAMRLAGAKDQPVARRLGIYRSVLEIAQRPEEKRQALAGLGDVASVDALDLVMKHLDDAALGGDAAMAAVRVARQLATVDPEKAKAALTRIKSATTSADIRRQADDAMAVVERGAMIDGYITAWALSGPYTQQDKDAGALFGIAFAPEQANANVAWRPIAAEGNPAIVHLDKAIGGNERVAYLRTIITSRTAQAAQLQLGSDDGVKVFLNGRAVFSNNTTRANTPGQDKANINLRQGQNVLMLKVTQGGGEWSACARLVSPTGGSLDGISVSAPTDR